MAHLSDFGTVSREHLVAEPDAQRLLARRLLSDRVLPKGSIQHVADASAASPSPRVTGTVKILPFLGLILTTALSWFLLVANVHHFASSGAIYTTVLSSRASIQIGIQILAGLLGFIHVTAATTLINYATRIRITSSSISLDGLRTWNGLSTPEMSWTLPFKLGAPLLLFVLVCLVPPALWAGALTPVATQVSRSAQISIPHYTDARDMVNVKEWPSEVTSGAPTVWTTQGIFSYAVGMKLQGSLLASAASGTTVDGGTRRHAKLDASTFEYIGRSYGIAASPGLVDGSIIAAQTLGIGYSYQEPGYASSVSCIYNKTSQFVLESVNRGGMLWSANGFLPDSNNASQPEQSLYIGRDAGDAIVAIGVASASAKAPMYLAFAAGRAYGILDKAQCHFNFTPSIFNVSVSLSNKTISVVPAGSAPAIDPSGILIRSAMRQYELIANDQTNIYTSLIGDSFNSSINNMRSSLEYREILDSMTNDEIALKAIENSVTVMMDDMLVAYGSAQLIIGNHTAEVPTVVQVQAIQFGEEMYIVLVFVLNTIVVLIVIAEAARTQWWRKLVTWDYMNPAELLLAGWRGGKRKHGESSVPALPESVWAVELDHESEMHDALIGKTKITVRSGLQAALHMHMRESSSGADVELHKIY